MRPGHQDRQLCSPRSARAQAPKLTLRQRPSCDPTPPRAPPLLLPGVTPAHHPACWRHRCLSAARHPQAHLQAPALLHALQAQHARASWRSPTAPALVQSLTLLWALNPLSSRASRRHSRAAQRCRACRRGSLRCHMPLQGCLAVLHPPPPLWSHSPPPSCLLLPPRQRSPMGRMPGPDRRSHLHTHVGHWRCLCACQGRQIVHHSFWDPGRQRRGANAASLRQKAGAGSQASPVLRVLLAEGPRCRCSSSSLARPLAGPPTAEAPQESRPRVAGKVSRLQGTGGIKKQQSAGNSGAGVTCRAIKAGQGGCAARSALPISAAERRTKPAHTLCCLSLQPATGNTTGACLQAACTMVSQVLSAPDGSYTHTSVRPAQAHILTNAATWAAGMACRSVSASTAASTRGAGGAFPER